MVSLYKLPCVAFGSGLVVVIETAATIVNENAAVNFDAMGVRESVTVTLNEPENVAPGVPESTPPLESVKPAGSDPVSLQ
jgi:hypothetical protein